MAKKSSAEKTAAELKEDLIRLKKKIETTERDELLDPFISMVLEAKKTGRVHCLFDACRRVMQGNHITEYPEMVTANVSTVLLEEIIEESDELSLDEPIEG